MRHPEFPVVSFLCILLLLCSLPSHIRAGSVSTMALIAWLGVMSLIRGINSLIWANNVDLKLEVWCDITTKITIGFTFAIPAAALCILRHLESVSSTRHARTTQADKRRRQKFEALMCFGVPVLFMALHYIVQGHRFDLFEDIGCAPTVYVSVAGLCLIYIPPIVLSLVSFIYAAMALRHFFRHRIEFAAHLQNSHAAISPGRYFRLMALAILEMVWDTGVNAYIIYFNTFTGLRPWISWEDVHSNFSRVQLLPEFLIPPEFRAQLIFQWWILPVSCIGFFIFFGFGEEAMADYGAATIWFRRNVLRQNLSNLPPYGRHPTLPTYRPRPHVNITMPATSDDASEHEPKAWDSLSLKMPDIMEHDVLPSSIDLSDPATSTHRTPSFLATLTLENRAPIVLEDNRSLSSGNDEPPNAKRTSESSSFLDAGQSTSTFPTDASDVYPPPIPTLIAKRPESRETGLGNFEPFPLPPTKKPLRTAHRVLPSSISQSTSIRRSADMGIIVSQAYLPGDATSRYHDEALFTNDAFNDVLPSRPEPLHPHLHGGIQMTVEKSVS